MDARRDLRCADLWWLVLALALCAWAPMANAQGAIPGSRKDANPHKLIDVIPALYGGDGVLLRESRRQGFEHSPHFLGSTLTTLNEINSQLTSGLNFSSLASQVSGFTFDLELGVPVQSTASLGPILTERAATLGRNRLNVAWSFTQVEFDRFEGQSLNDIGLVFPHEDSNGDDVIGNPNFEVDEILVDLDLDIAQKVIAIFLKYGVTDRLDVGVVVPVIESHIRADAFATVQRNRTDPPVAADPTMDPRELHLFDPTTGDSPDSTSKLTKWGIGDVLVRAKYHLVKSDDSLLPDIGVVGQVKTPSGDHDDLFGTGDTRILGLLVVDRDLDALAPLFPWDEADSYLGYVTPHVNAGYEFVVGHSSRANVQFAVGADVRVHERVTLVGDFLGRWEHNSDRPGKKRWDVSAGAKFKVWNSLLLVTNFILPVNRDAGLRSDLIWSVGCEYTFGLFD